jgi:hypothetical protein
VTRGTSTLPATGLTKELRALARVLIAGVLPMFAAAFLVPGHLGWTAVAAYMLAALGLGAWSIGHEHSAGTLPLLLTQPEGRRSLFGTKLFALALSLAVLGGAAAVCLHQLLLEQYVVDRFSWQWYTSTRTTIGAPTSTTFLLPLLCGFCLTPWLTMVCRNAIAGVVFTAAIPAVTWFGSEAVLTAVYGAGASIPMPIRQREVAVLWGTCLVCCLVGAWRGWRTFLTLEISTTPVELRWPSRTRSTARSSRTDGASQPRARRSPAWMLVLKETRLYTMVAPLAGLYILAAAAVSFTAPPDLLPPLIGMTSLAYIVLTAGIIGALASADERRMGTIGWQLLLPVSTVRQWTVKLIVAVVLTLLSTLALPLAVLAVTHVREYNVFPRAFGFVSWDVELSTLFLMFLGLYVSAWSRDGLHALVAVPAAVAGVLALEAGGLSLGSHVVDATARTSIAWALRHFPAGFTSPAFVLAHRLEGYSVDVWLTAAMAVLAWLALERHRHVDVSRGDVIRHVAVLGALACAGFLVTTAWRVVTQTMWWTTMAIHGQLTLQ